MWLRENERTEMEQQFGVAHLYKAAIAASP
jgi:hypothetical protein